MMSRTKTYRALERVVRGFSNHRRIEIMETLHGHPELSVDDIARRLKINYKTAANHLLRLAIAGLVLKRNHAASVRHKLSAQGVLILKFLRTLE